MSQSMINKVAKAIQEYWLDNGYDPSEQNNNLAKVAILALLEPDENMLSAANCACDDFGQVMIKSGYKTMIEDAAKE